MSKLDTELQRYFEFHHGKELGYGHNRRRVDAIIFKKPDALIDHRVKIIHELIRGVGPNGVEALAELVLIITGTAKPQRREA